MRKILKLVSGGSIVGYTEDEALILSGSLADVFMKKHLGTLYEKHKHSERFLDQWDSCRNHVADEIECLLNAWSRPVVDGEPSQEVLSSAELVFKRRSRSITVLLKQKAIS